MKPVSDSKPNDLSIPAVSDAKGALGKGKPGTSWLPGFLYSSPHRGWLLGLFLLTITIIAYLPALNGGFIWDDDAYVTQNQLLSAPDGLRLIWFSLESPSQYFPLTYTVFRIEHALWGLNPLGYHLVNVLLHAINALLVWLLLKRLSVPGAWLAAAIFALHPVQVESVAWIAELKSILSLFFFLLALLAWVEFIKDRPKPPWGFYLLSVTFYALALFSKTTACTLPAALLLILWLKGRPINRSRWTQMVPFLVMGVGMGLVAMWWERYHQDTRGTLFAYSLVDRILIASHAVWFYPGKLVWPANLTFSYPKWTINPADPFAYGWLVMGASLGGAIYFVRRFVGRGVEVAALFYVATLSPMLGFIMLYTFRYTFVADHYQYVAMIGPTALAAAGITLALDRFRKGNRFLKPVFSGMLLAALGVLTWRQTGMYTDNETLWRTTIAKNPECWMAYANLGVALAHKGQLDEAIRDYRKAIQINPNAARALDALGVALSTRGRFDEAIQSYQRAARIDSNRPDIFLHLAMTLDLSGRSREAVVQYRKALELNPNLVVALNNLAWVLAVNPEDKLRNGAEAISLAKRACELTHYDNPSCIGTLAAAYAEAGRFPEAVTMSQKAEQLATTAGLESEAAENRKLLKLYRAGKPYREPATKQQ